MEPRPIATSENRGRWDTTHPASLQHASKLTLRWGRLYYGLGFIPIPTLRTGSATVTSLAMGGERYQRVLTFRQFLWKRTSPQERRVALSPSYGRAFEALNAVDLPNDVRLFWEEVLRHATRHGYASYVSRYSKAEQYTDITRPWKHRKTDRRYRTATRLYW